MRRRVLKFTTHLLIFFAGVALAIFVVRSANQTRLEVRSRARLAEPSSRGSSSSSAVVFNELEQRNVLSQKTEETLGQHPSMEHIEVLKEAVREGGLDSLQLIRTEYLSFIPEYRNLLLSELKEEALLSLVTRFSISDWRDWPKSGFARNGQASRAREFVDNITVVNPELGRFLETSALLLHGMYLSIMGGNSYSIEDGLLNIVAHAERLFPKRRNTAVPARLLLDLGVHQDRAFKKVFEKVRGDLVLTYIERFPNELETHLNLLLDLSPQFVDSRVYETLTQAIYRLALDTSLKYREDIFEQLLRSSTLEEFWRRDSKIRQSLAELYVIGAVDALEADSLQRASGLLNVSEELVQGLPAQDAVRSYLFSYRSSETPRRPRMALDNGAEGLSARDASKGDYFDGVLSGSIAIPDRNSQGSGWTFVKNLLFLLLAIGLPIALVARLIKWRMDRRAANLDAQTRSRLKKEPAVPLGSGAEIHFDEEEDLSNAVNR